jgi:hypothetical protein
MLLGLRCTNINMQTYVHDGNVLLNAYTYTNEPTSSTDDSAPSQKCKSHSYEPPFV